MNTYIIPDDVAFECQQCGQCCGNKWSIGVEDSIRSKWQQATMLQVFPDALERLEPYGTAGFHHRLKHAADGNCVFLTAQKTCGIHARVGREFKPGNCILFPYQFTRTPRGITVGLMFDCTGVGSEGMPARAGLSPEVLDDVFRHCLHVNELPKQFRLSERGVVFGYDAYEKFQQLLMRFCARGFLPIEEGLIAGAVLLRLADEFLEQAVRKGYDAAKVLSSFFRNAEANDFELVRSRLKRVPVSPEEQNNFFNFLMSSHEATSTTGGRAEMVSQLMSQAFTRDSERDAYHSVFLQADVSLKAMVEIAFDPNAEPTQSQLRRYLRHLVFRHLLVEHFGALAEGYLFLLIVYGAIRWYARAIAHLAGADAVTAEHVQRAIRVVDMNCVASNKLHHKLTMETNLKREFNRWHEDRLTPYRIVQTC